jgi:hypothetical protein
MGAHLKLSTTGPLTEIQAQEMDLYKILEQLKELKCEIVSLFPLKDTLEEIFLREIEKTGGKPL